MKDREEEITDRARKNMEEFLDRGPGLRYSTRSWVVGRDRTRKKVLLGGLGGIGVGQMWFDESPRHAEDSTFADAPEVSCDE